jgi:MFS family permease
LAESLPVPWRPAWLIASQGLTGLGMAFYLVHSTPYLMQITGAQERDHAFSAQSALWPLAAFVGSLVGGALPELWSRVLGLSLDHPAPYRYTLFVAGACLLPSVLPLCLSRDTGREGVPAARGQAQPPPAASVRTAASFPLFLFAPIIAVGVLRIAGESAVRSFFNVYLDVEHGLSPVRIGGWMAFGQLIGAPAAMVSPLVSARLGRHRTVAWGAACTGFLLLPLALIPRPVAAGISWVGLTMLVAIVRPPFMVYAQTSVGPRWQSLMSGATNLAAGLGSALILPLGGYAVSALGFQGFFAIPAALFVVAGALFGVCLSEQGAEESG